MRGWKGKARSLGIFGGQLVAASAVPSLRLGVQRAGGGGWGVSAAYELVVWVAESRYGAPGFAV